MNQTALTFVALGGAVLLWSAGTALTTYVADQPAREYASKAHSEQAGHEGHDHATGRGVKPAEMPKTDKEIETFVKKEVERLTTELDKSVRDNNKSLQEEVRVKLANFLFESGIRFSKSEYLKDSVGSFHEILQINPEQKDALIGLATLSLHVGAGDKAEEYYTKYLKLEPGDLSARSNLALAQARAGKEKEAFKTIDGVLKDDPKLVIAIVTKGLIYREQGKFEEAVKLFTEAEKLETSPILLQRIAELKSEKKTESTSGDIIAYFKGHQILGKKLKNIKANNDVLEVYLSEFPVDQMPEYARAKLEGNMKAELAKSKYSKVQLMDADSKKVLIEVVK